MDESIQTFYIKIKTDAELLKEGKSWNDINEYRALCNPLEEPKALYPGSIMDKDNPLVSRVLYVVVGQLIKDMESHFEAKVEDIYHFKDYEVKAIGSDDRDIDLIVKELSKINCHYRQVVLMCTGTMARELFRDKNYSNRFARVMICTASIRWISTEITQHLKCVSCTFTSFQELELIMKMIKRPLNYRFAEVTKNNETILLEGYFIKHEKDGVFLGITMFMYRPGWRKTVADFAWHGLESKVKYVNPNNINALTKAPLPNINQQKVEFDDNISTDPSLLKYGDMIVKVRDIDGNIYTFNLDRNATVLNLKAAIQEALKIPIDGQRLIYSAKQLEEGKKLSEYKITDNSIVHTTTRLSTIAK